MASALAEATSRVEIGTLVVATSFRNPALLAKMAASVDEVSGGRLILGVGCGWHDPEYEAFGYPTDHKVSRFAEAVEIVEALLHRGETTFAGRYHTVRNCVLVPPPARRIPILVAAQRPRMLEHTARHADAWNTAWYGQPDERLADVRAALDAACARVGRAVPPTITVGLQIYYPDLHATREGGALTGSADEIAHGLAEHARRGAEHAIAWLVPSTPEALARFAEAVARYRQLG
jgi:alkanesulfonate monooxygenase SsuD/methylene tetrahydromethanopterin reductase-like flavin-dependent oxidoreductase (luciferase family)